MPAISVRGFRPFVLEVVYIYKYTSAAAKIARRFFERVGIFLSCLLLDGQLLMVLATRRAGLAFTRDRLHGGAKIG
jgi:hypothetical protein